MKSLVLNGLFHFGDLVQRTANLMGHSRQSVAHRLQVVWIHYITHFQACEEAACGRFQMVHKYCCLAFRHQRKL